MFTTPSVTPGARFAPAPPTTGGRKRKQVSYTYDNEDDYSAPSKKSRTVIDLTNSDDDDLSVQPKRSPAKKRKAPDDEPKTKTKDTEKRLRRYRARAPQSYLEIKSRALTQRLTVLSRERCGTDEVPEEKIVMAGSTGNVYTQHICQVPSCNCPHAMKGNQCKHIVYVMLRVLKAREDIGYQLALTSPELRDLFANAAPIPGSEPQDSNNVAADAVEEDGNRKPIEGECPICYADFEPNERSNIVYCKASCGNNVHKDCMQSWATAKAGKVTCPYCRAQWAEDDIGGGFSDNVGDVNLDGAERTEEGYVNVARQLGISGERDYSSYHQPWVSRRLGGGEHRYVRRW
jgi:hypothetical protein